MKKLMLILAIVAGLLTLGGCDSKQAEAETVRYDELAGSFRLATLTAENGTEYKESNIDTAAPICLDIEAEGAVIVDSHDLVSGITRSLEGSVKAEIDAAGVESLGSPLGADADRYYELTLGGKSAYLGLWEDTESMELYLGGCLYSFLPDDHIMFDDTCLEGVMDNDGVFCLHADGSVSWPEPLSFYGEYGVHGGAEPLIIDREAGDRLIYIGDMVYYEGEHPDSFEMEWSVEKYYWSGESVDFFAIEEFDGEDIKGKFTKHNSLRKDTQKLFEPLGYVIVPIESGEEGEAFILSTEPAEYSYGWFEGTDWYEESGENYIPYYEFISNGSNKNNFVFSAPVIKGREGYFAVDLSEVEAGLYFNVFDSGSFDGYVFDIR